jgi:hypothetical protein
MAEGVAPPTRSREHHRAFLSLAAFFLLLHGVWFGVDERGPFADQFRYYEQALHFRGHELALDHPSHPPLYPALAALIPGNGFHHLRWLNLVLILGSLWLVHRWAQQVLPDAGSLAAAALALTTPLVVSVQHLFYIEVLLFPLVVATWLLLPSAAKPASTQRMLALGLVGGLGLLTKWTWPVFVLPAVLAALRYASLRSWLLSAAMATLVAGPWYLTHWSDILQFAHEGVISGAGWISRTVGMEGLLYYPKAIAGSWWSLVLTLLACVGVVSVWRSSRRCGLVSAANILFPLLVFALIPTKKARHLLPILGLLSILSVQGVLSLCAARIRKLALGLLVAGGLGAACAVSFMPAEVHGQRMAGLPLTMRSHGDDPGPPTRASVLAPLVADIATAVPPESRVLLAFHLAELRDTDFSAAMLATNNPRRFPLIPLALPEPEALRHFPLTVSRGSEGNAGVLEVTHILLRSGPLWLRVQSGLPVHRHASALQEALLDPDGALADVGETKEFPAADGSALWLWTPKDAASTRRALLQLALREDPDHDSAWKELDETIPPPQRRLGRLVELGLLPSACLGLDSSDKAERLAAARLILQHHSHLTSLVLRIAALDEPELATVAQRLLNLRDDFHTRPHTRAIVQRLVAEHHTLGDRRAVLRWIHRGLKCNALSASDAQALLLACGEAAGSETRVTLLQDLAVRLRSAMSRR